MTDLDAVHPELGNISPDNTPEISAAFKQAQLKLMVEGISVSGDFESAWIDSTAVCRVVAQKLGLTWPEGYFAFADYHPQLASAQWDNDKPLERQAQLFIEVCISLQLDIYFS